MKNVLVNIKVAYDITVLGNFFSRPDPKTGIYRVTEEVMSCLFKRDDINLSIIGLCGDHPILSDVSCLMYSEENSNTLDSKYINSYVSKLSLDKIYKKIFRIYFSREFQQSSKFSPQSITIRGILKLLDYTHILKFDLTRTFPKNNFDIFHSPYYQLPSIEITGNIPRILTIYDLIPITNKEFVSPSLTKYFQGILDSINYQKDWILCISEYTKQQFCEYTGMSPDRTFVTPLAADDRFHPILNLQSIKESRKRYKIPEGDYFLCIASQLEPRKNISHLVKCFVNLISEDPNLDINLVLIGSQYYKREELTNLSKLLSKYKERIIFTGYVPDHDLSSLYSGATAFIFPSLQEGFGLPILEAMQCGTPVISSNATSLPEVAGDAAILVNPKNQDDLCQSMLNLLTDKSLQEQLKQKGLERAKEFSWSKCVDKTVEVYKKAINNR